MPDLSNAGSHKFWQEYPDPSIYRIVSFMEGVEEWTLDGDPELEQAISELGAIFDNIGNIDLREEDKFIELSSYIKMGRSLRLLQCIDTAYPGAASKILMHAEQTSQDTKEANSATVLFLQRNIIFERLRLLSRIFAEDRLTTISKTLGGEANG